MAAHGVSHPLPWPQVDEPLCHGYTVVRVSRLSIEAVRRLRWVQNFDHDDCLSAAHHAIIEHLYTCDETPDDPVLIRVGMRAASRHRNTELSQHGIPVDKTKGTGERFQVYWRPLAAPRRGADESVVERVTFWQVWRSLDAEHQEVLTARAESGSPAEAAGRLGLPTHQYQRRIQRARQEFRRLWHEGETPSGAWRRDLHADSYKGGRTITRRAFPRSPNRSANLKRKNIAITNRELLNRYLAGESLRVLSAALGISSTTLVGRLKDAGYVPYSTRPTAPPVPEKDLGISNEELLKRHRAGESWKALAKEFGVTSTTIYRRALKAGYVPQPEQSER